MVEIKKLNNVIDCSELSTGEIDFQVKNLMFNHYKNILLKNASEKSRLLHGLKGNIKVEIIGDVGAGFANDTEGIKVIVNGNVGNDSVSNVESSKFTVFGSCLNNFGRNPRKSEFYILENCGNNSFFNLDVASNVVIGGQVKNRFATNLNGGRIVVLNLSGGNMFIEDDWFEGYRSGCIYLRGEKNKIKITSGRFILEEVNNNDEDVYLPLISEFARLFNYSLNEIKSRPFCRIMFK